MATDHGAATRNSGQQRSVTGAVEMFRTAIPFIRPLFMAAVATALIMIGLPAVLALGAAAGS